MAHMEPYHVMRFRMAQTESYHVYYIMMVVVTLIVAMLMHPRAPYELRLLRTGPYR